MIRKCEVTAILVLYGLPRYYIIILYVQLVVNLYKQFIYSNANGLILSVFTGYWQVQFLLMKWCMRGSGLKVLVCYLGLFAYDYIKIDFYQRLFQKAHDFLFRKYKMCFWAIKALLWRFFFFFPYWFIIVFGQTFILVLYTVWNFLICYFCYFFVTIEYLCYYNFFQSIILLKK